MQFLPGPGLSSRQALPGAVVPALLPRPIDAVWWYNCFMSRTTILVAFLAGVLAAEAFAQAFTVAYLDGTVELQAAKGWGEVAIGDRVPADATVRISQTGSLELVRAGTLSPHG